MSSQTKVDNAVKAQHQELAEVAADGAPNLGSSDVNVFFSSGYHLTSIGLTQFIQGHFLGTTLSDSSAMKLRYFELRRAKSSAALIYFKTRDEVSGTPKGILLLNKNSSVQRTKNQRDGFHFCIRLDSLESSSSCSPSVKQWSKLVMILRSEAELTEWIRVIRSVVSGDMVTSVNRNSFLPPNVLSDNMVVYQGKGLKEAHSVGFSIIDGTLMKPRFFILKIQNGVPVLLYFKGENEQSGNLKGVMELDHQSTAKRTKNSRDGFDHCIRVDSPNAKETLGAVPELRAGMKRWTKLVVALRSDHDALAWLNAITWALKFKDAKLRADSGLEPLTSATPKKPLPSSWSALTGEAAAVRRDEGSALLS